MPIPRQQRTRNNRGQLPFAQLASAAPIISAASNPAPQTLQLDFAAPMQASASLLVSQIRNVTDGLLPVTAFPLSPTSWQFTYAALTLPCQFQLDAFDPYLRSAQGGYACPFDVTLPAAPAPPAPPTVEFVTNAGSLNLDVSVWNSDDLGGTIVLPPTPSTGDFRVFALPANLSGLTVDVMDGATVVNTQSPSQIKTYTWDGATWVVT